MSSQPEYDPRLMAYTMEVYTEEDPKTPWEVYRSTLPFAAVHLGDVIYPYSVVENKCPWAEPPNGNGLRITKVEHILWVSKTHINQKLMVHTEVVIEAP